MPNVKAEYVPASKIAEKYGVSAKTVRAWARHFGCPHARPGGVYRFVESEVARWARANKPACK